MIPKIEFRYSGIYDSGYRNSPLIQEFLKKNNQRYPSVKTIENYVIKIEPLWRKQESRILGELSKVTALKWKDEGIICYIVGRCIPFSDPLTLSAYKNKNDFIDTLIHELIHQLFTQEGNYEELEKVWNYIFKKYKKESRMTKIHIPLHAIHSHIYLKFFDKKRLNREIKNISFLQDYKRSWEIVEEEGYENIIREFRKRIR